MASLFAGDRLWALDMRKVQYADPAANPLTELGATETDFLE